MKILFLGDSITEGVGASSIENSYVNRVATLSGYTCENYGISGTRIAKQKNELYPLSTEYFLKRAKRMPKKADYVFVFGGTNDYGHGDAEIGDKNSTSPYTFYGALKRLCEYLIKTYGKEKVCFILPLHRFNENNLFGDGSKKKPSLTLQGYVDIFKEVLNGYKLKYMCLDKYFPIPNTNKGDALLIDGLHPNDNGHKLLADICVNHLKENLSL